MKSEEWYFEKVCEDCRDKGNEGKLCDDCKYINKKRDCYNVFDDDEEEV